MKINIFSFLTKCFIIITAIAAAPQVHAQRQASAYDNLRFGGSLGLGFGNNYTQVLVAPGALYQFNQYVGAGLGLQYNYVRFDEVYKSSMYGGSVIGIFSPLPQIQLSAELEQLRVNLEYDRDYLNDDGVVYADNKRNFWNTALFLGAGYNTGPVTVGIRYNVLFDDNDFVYADALLPFVRVYF